MIDALGGYTVYGEAETAEITARDGLLPIGVAVGCKLRRDIPKDAALTYADVELPAGRLVDRLRAEQDALFGLKRRAAPEATAAPAGGARLQAAGGTPAAPAPPRRWRARR